MPIDIPKHIRAEAQRAEFFAELVKRADRLNSLEQAEADSLALIERNRGEAAAILADAGERFAQAETKAMELRQAAAEALDTAKADAERIVADAKAQAERELAAARGECLAQQTAAQEAEERAAAANRAHATMVRRLSDLEPKVREAEAVITKADALSKLMKG